MWIGATVATLLLGLVLIIVPILVGGCSCPGECVVNNQNSCSSPFGGCTRPPYDENKCRQLVISNAMSGGTAPCDDPACKFTEGMDPGAVWGMIFAGTAILILCCVFACGICPCLCFKSSVSAAQPPQGTAVPTAPIVGVEIHTDNTADPTWAQTKTQKQEPPSGAPPTGAPATAAAANVGRGCCPAGA